MPTEITEASQIPSGKVVIDFFAQWCGPCKRIAPLFEELSTKFPSITFLKVDVDEAEGLSNQFSVESLPTFIYLKDNVVQFRVDGANINAILDNLKNLESL
jgi:thioredoxin 1